MTSALSGDDSVIVVIVSREGGREGARKSFLRFTAMEDWREGELKQLSMSVRVRPSIHSPKTNRNGKNGGERIGGGGGGVVCVGQF